ncbi:MAG: hypothetical protein NT157_05325 [Candidatus Micrarchaeota archaeon]|nr:hypothetical protein [Candidatus Micrarchaeota archaeon]
MGMKMERINTEKYLKNDGMNSKWRLLALAFVFLAAFSAFAYAQACSVDGEHCDDQLDCCPDLQLACVDSSHTCTYVGCSMLGGDCADSSNCCPNQRLGCVAVKCVAVACKESGDPCSGNAECCSDLGLECDGTCQYKWRAIWENWRPIALTLLLIMMLSIALAYMASTVLNLEGLKHWAYAEFLQAGASAIMVLGLLLLVDLLMTLSSPIIFQMADNAGLVVPQGKLSVEQASNQLVVAQYYLRGSVQCLKDYYRFTSFLGSGMEAMGSIMLPAQGMDDMANIAYTPFGTMAHVICHNLTFLLIVQYFQIHLLDFISYATVGFLLPLGVVLRILPFTRGLGSFFIALTLGLYFVYPAMYVFLLTVMPKADCALKVEPYDDRCLDNPVALSAAMGEMKSETNYNIFVAMYNHVQNEVSLLMLQGFIYPLVNLTVTFTFVRALMQLMGLDMSEVGQGLIKLI